MGVGLCAVGGRGLLAQAPAQPAPPLPPPINLTDDPILEPFVWRSIGPANMGGRVDDIAVVESNPSIIYVGFATGGIWKTTNNGTTWTPIFDEYPVSSIGDIAIAPSEPRRHLRRHRRAEQPPELVVRRRHLQVDRRRQDVRVRRPEGNAEHRPRRRPPEGSEHRLRRRARASVRAERRARPVQDDRRRQDLDEHEVHRQRHGLHRRRDGPVESERALRRLVPAPARSVGLQRRRTRQRPVEDNRRRQEVDEAHRQRPSRQSDNRPDRDRHRALQAGHDLRVVRSRSERRHRRRRQRRRHADAAGRRAAAAAVAADVATRTHQPPPPIPRRAACGVRTTAARRGGACRIMAIGWMYYSQVRIDPTNPEIAYQGGAPFFKTVDGGKTLAPGAGDPAQRPSRDLDRSEERQPHPARQRRRPRRHATTRRRRGST